MKTIDIYMSISMMKTQSTMAAPASTNATSANDFVRNIINSMNNTLVPNDSDVVSSKTKQYLGEEKSSEHSKKPKAGESQTSKTTLSTGPTKSE